MGGKRQRGGIKWVGREWGGIKWVGRDREVE